MLLLCLLLISSCSSNSPINRSPSVFIEQRDPSIANGVSYSFTAIVDDPDGDDLVLTWYLDGEERATTADAQGISLLLTPELETVYQIHALVSDGELESADTTTLTVSGPNGGVQISIVPEFPDFASVSLSENTLTFEYGSAVNVEAVGVTAGDECVWYLDGNPVYSGIDLTQIAIGSELSIGNHLLTVIIITDGSYRSDTLEIVVTQNA